MNGGNREVTIWASQMRPGGLPAVCVKTGAPADAWVRRTYSTAPALGPRVEVRKVPESPNDRVVVLKRVHPNFVLAVLAQQRAAQQQAPASPATPR